MYVYQNGKLYVQSGNKLVWVEIYPDFSFTITDEVVEKEPTGVILTNKEVKAKFHLPTLVPVERKQPEIQQETNDVLEFPTMKNTVAEIKAYAEHVNYSFSDEAETKKVMLKELEAHVK